MIFRILALILLQLSLTLPAQAQKTGGILSLHFDWPSGLVAHIEQEWIKIKITPDGADTLKVRSTKRMRTYLHPDGLLIRTDSFRLPDIDPTKPSKVSSRLSELISPAQTIQPDYIINSNGAFVRVENIELMRAAFDSLFGVQIAQSKSAPALFDSLLSRERITSSRSEEWNAIVGMWISGKFKLGQVYEVSTQQSSPMVPGIMFPIKNRIKASEWTSCEASDPGKHCIQLSITTAIDSTTFISYLDSIAAKTGGPIPEEVRKILLGIRIGGEATLITDPSTLIPYSLITKKSAGGWVKGSEKQKEGEYVEEEIRTYRFNYDRRR